MNQSSGVRFLVSSLFAFALIALGGDDAHAQQAGIEVGVQAPTATVETLDGESVDLGDVIAGKVTVLEFWATWCPLCRALEPSIADAQDHFGDRVQWVRVGVPQNQSAARQKAYAERAGLRGEFVFDVDGDAIAAYMVPHTSYLVVLDAQGRVVYTGVGEDQDVVAAVDAAFSTMEMGHTP